MWLGEGAKSTDFHRETWKMFLSTYVRRALKFVLKNIFPLPNKFITNVQENLEIFL